MILKWCGRRGVANKAIHLLVDDLIYMIGDRGIASCIDAKIGEQVWNERIGGEYPASSVYGDDGAEAGTHLSK